MIKSYLFILKNPPHNGIHLAETLDMLLTTAAFEQSVSILLLDQAIFHLKANQRAHCQQLKETALLFSSFPLYDISRLYVEYESLQRYQLTQNSLILPTESVYRKQLATFMADFDIIISE